MKKEFTIENENKFEAHGFETIKLSTLQQLIAEDSPELDWEPRSIEYDEGSEVDDLFVSSRIVSPHWHQASLDCWIPVELYDQLDAEYELTGTTQYHKWSSKFGNKLTDEYPSERYTWTQVEEDAVELANEIMSELRAVGSVTIKLYRDSNDCGEQFKCFELIPSITSAY